MESPIQEMAVQAYRRRAISGQEEAQQPALTGATGSYDLKLERSGVWMVRTVKIAPPSEDQRSRLWHSYWASLTFEVNGAN